MKYLLRLSGEHPSLPLAEVKGVLEGESIDYGLSDLEGYVLADLDSGDGKVFARCAYTLSACEYLGESETLGGLAGDVYDILGDVESFRVSASSSIEKEFGHLLHSLGLGVDLKNPEADIHVIEHDGVYHAGLKLDLGRDYEVRRPQYRPYFHPTSMHPKLARSLVNLARVCGGDVVVDPFCGTGGILIEAGLMGMKPVGFDIDAKMVEGCTQNLGNYGLCGDVGVCDALEADIVADAVVTDPPYGRASSLRCDDGSLYERFVDRARDMLDAGSFMVMVLPSDKGFVHCGFELVETFDVRMHKSLTRRIWVMQAI